ncbi:hypothetical protein P4256_28770 [Bacillus wiedmannii]|uniref:hypothetical protein n=1 Tax=Bacillus wiedmannii TaxID=1890302 RepID=UPI002E1B9B5F|nr:hypothetical protein [Bacillus wiedmannii]
MSIKKVILAGSLGIAAITGINLPGLESITASAAVQEVHTTVEGKVIEIESSYFVIESKQLKENVTIYTDLKYNLKKGEYIKVNSEGPLRQNAFTTSLTANSVERFELVPGEYNNNKGIYIVGNIEEVFSKGVEVSFIDESGDLQYISVPLKQEHNFKVNDLVKVSSDQWFRSNPIQPINPIVEKVKTQLIDFMNENNSYKIKKTTDFIKKSNDTSQQIINGDQWIWS